MHTEYKCDAIRQLRDQQVRFAPREKKVEQADAAERLLREIRDDRDYNFEFVCYRVTGFRPEKAPIVKISSSHLRHDLHAFIEDLSESADLMADEIAEPVHTMDDLSRMFNVTTKTISRWRRHGLVSRKLCFNSTRRTKRIGFLQSSVNYFIKQNREKVERGERFSQLTTHDKEDIIERARRLVRAGGCPAEVAKRIARHFDRSVETIRYTIRQFDEKNPHLAVFPNFSGPLNLEMKERVFQEFVKGRSAETLAKRYCRTKTTIYRIVNEMRARAIFEWPLEFIDSPEFHRRNAYQRIVESEMPVPEKPPRKSKPPAELPRYLASLYEVPLLTREQEQHLFRKLNFLKCRASKLRETLDLSRPKTAVMDEIERLFTESVKIKNHLVQSNLRLVVSIAKRHMNAADDFFTLVSDGNMSLIRSVEKFDYTRGNKFSTYASWAIMKNFARTIPNEYRQTDRFRPTSEELFLARADERSDWYLLESAQAQRTKQVSEILSTLDEREQQIIISRFGLDYSEEPRTLKEVGALMGVTKERIRQIEARALNKLRLAAREGDIVLPDTLLESEN